MKIKHFISAAIVMGSILLVPALSVSAQAIGQVDNPLGNKDICGLIGGILKAIMLIGLPISVLFIVYSGFKFVTAQGNTDKLKEARENFLYTIIGIAVFFGAWVIVGVLTGTINQFITSGNQISSSCGR